ncbi:hypothetical protein CesoFtcFv8_013419 [Champsocephalus esox]|uniref:Uncharacterized protein n=1 Tax=Champsocephalus esox TaxID=159716 RepID=A0AAN8GVU5_9TELE|nr:hypothetical protein CesoFtcFv8_013419 [Champsocephalus esox]
MCKPLPTLDDPPSYISVPNDFSFPPRAHPTEPASILFVNPFPFCPVPTTQFSLPSPPCHDTLLYCPTPLGNRPSRLSLSYSPAPSAHPRPITTHLTFFRPTPSAHFPPLLSTMRWGGRAYKDLTRHLARHSTPAPTSPFALLAPHSHLLHERQVPPQPPPTPLTASTHSLQPLSPPHFCSPFTFSPTPLYSIPSTLPSLTFLIPLLVPPSQGSTTHLRTVTYLPPTPPPVFRICRSSAYPQPPPYNAVLCCPTGT